MHPRAAMTVTRHSMRPHPWSRALATAVCVALSIGGSSPTMATPTGDASPPVAIVEVFHTALLDVMRRADELTPEERYRRLEAPVKAAFNLPLMIRIASAGAWQEADEDQRRRLVAAFERMSVGSYAYRFDGYSGESFETVGEEPGPRRTVLVETRIVQPDDDPVSLTYVVRRAGERFRIVDVLLARGVSELAVRRSEYQAVLGREGVDGLIAVLDRKAEDLVPGLVRN